jgi:hypothetical protein
MNAAHLMNLGRLTEEPADLEATRFMLADPIIRCRLAELLATPEALALRAQISGRITAARKEGQRPTGGYSDFAAWVCGAISWAHDPAHELAPEVGDTPIGVYPDRLVFRLILPGAFPPATVSYSADRVDGIRFRHLSAVLRMMGEVGPESIDEPALIAAMDPVISAVFPGEAPNVTVVMDEPRQVARDGGPLHAETPIVYHAFLEFPIAEE